MRVLLRSLFGCAFLTMSLVHCGSCAKGGKTDAKLDAAANDAAAAAVNERPSGPWEITIVARALGASRMTLEVMPDDGLIVRNGVYTYVVAPNAATVERLGQPADYAAFVKDTNPDSPMQLGGYGTAAPYYGSDPVVGTSSAHPFIRLHQDQVAGGMFGGAVELAAQGAEYMTWNGKAWTKVFEKDLPTTSDEEDEEENTVGGQTKPPRLTQGVATPKDAGGGDASAKVKGDVAASRELLPDPRDHSNRHYKTKEGHVVWLFDGPGSYTDQFAETSIVTRVEKRPGQVERALVKIPIPPTGNAQNRHCELMKSFDSEVYLKCMSSFEHSYNRVTDFYRLARKNANEWEWLGLNFGITPGEPEHQRENRVFTIDVEGNFWRMTSSQQPPLHENEMHLLRERPTVKGGATVAAAADAAAAANDAEHREEFVLPEAPWNASAPFYSSNSETLAAAARAAGGQKQKAVAPSAHGSGGGDGDEPGEASYRQWSTLTVTDKHPSPEYWVGSVAPRKSGDVWVLAHERQTEGSVLMRLARRNVRAAPPKKNDAGAVTTDAGVTDAGVDGAAPPSYVNPNNPPVVLIRSATDQLLEARNAQGAPQRWVGHCATVFVPFPLSVAKDAEKAEAFYAARKTQIAALITKDEADKKTGKPKQQADLYVVQGSFGDRKVAGAVFIREHPETSEDLMEANASKLAELVTENPASPPEIVCSLPLLDKVIATYKADRVIFPQYE